MMGGFVGICGGQRSIASGRFAAVPAAGIPSFVQHIYDFIEIVICNRVVIISFLFGCLTIFQHIYDLIEIFVCNGFIIIGFLYGQLTAVLAGRT